MLLVKNLTDAADALLNKAGNWSGKDKLSAVLKKIKKDVSKGLDQGSVTPQCDLPHPSPLNILRHCWSVQCIFLTIFCCCSKRYGVKCPSRSTCKLN